MPEQEKVVVTGTPVNETQEQKDAKKNQEKVAKQQEAAGKTANEYQEKEAKFIEEMQQKFEKFTQENGGTNLDVSELSRRLGTSLTGKPTVAAAAKVRQSAVVEVPAEDGRPGVQTKPLASLVAGEKPASGESMPTANPVKAPGSTVDKLPGAEAAKGTAGGPKPALAGSR